MAGPAKEFDAFPGAILMTTNCIQKPEDTYKARIFTSGLVAWPGVTHISNGDFSPIIDAALDAEGFTEDGSDKTILVGFAHNAVMEVAGTVIDAVKKGDIRHFFLIGGCDGAKSGRNYYTELAEAVPKDCVILTLACGKYRLTSWISAILAGFRVCSTAVSAMMPTPPSRLPWPWPMPSKRMSTACRFRWYSPGMSRKPSAFC